MNLLTHLNNKERIKGVNILHVVNYHVPIYTCHWSILTMSATFDKQVLYKAIHVRDVYLRIILFCCQAWFLI